MLYPVIVASQKLFRFQPSYTIEWLCLNQNYSAKWLGILDMDNPHMTGWRVGARRQGLSNASWRTCFYFRVLGIWGQSWFSWRIAVKHLIVPFSSGWPRSGRSTHVPTWRWLMAFPLKKRSLGKRANMFFFLIKKSLCGTMYTPSGLGK